MTEEMERKEIISQLITQHKDNVKTNELLTILVMQMIELNKLNKQVIYYSGGDPKLTPKHIQEELDHLMAFVEARSEETQNIVKKLALPKPE